jgi:hypothetical protein
MPSADRTQCVVPLAYTVLGEYQLITVDARSRGYMQGVLCSPNSSTIKRLLLAMEFSSSSCFCCTSESLSPSWLLTAHFTG